MYSMLQYHFPHAEVFQAADRKSTMLAPCFIFAENET